MLDRFFKGDDAIILGNNPGTHPSELLHLIWRCPDLRGLKFSEHSCFHEQFEQDLGDVLLGAEDFLLDGLGDGLDLFPLFLLSFIHGMRDNTPIYQWL